MNLVMEDDEEDEVWDIGWGDSSIATDATPEAELVIGGVQISVGGWVKVDDGCITGKDKTKGVYYQRIATSSISVEEPEALKGSQGICWADGSTVCVYKGRCARCCKTDSMAGFGPTVLEAKGGTVAFSYILCPGCLEWVSMRALEELNEKAAGIPSSSSALLKLAPDEIRGPHCIVPPTISHPSRWTGSLSLGDTLLGSSFARQFPKCLYSTLVPAKEGRWEEQRALAAEAARCFEATGEIRRRMAKEIQMRMRCAQEFNMCGGDYLVWHAKDGTRIDYYGATKRGKANGVGFVEHGKEWWCFGHFKNGSADTTKAHPEARCWWSNGDEYSGNMVKGRPHGRGVKVWQDGNRYEGEFAMGKEHGSGVMHWSDGSEHTGRFRHGLRDGTDTANNQAGASQPVPGRLLLFDFSCFIYARFFWASGYFNLTTLPSHSLLDSLKLPDC
ncbi:unnamed protein product [Chrysoparadoxa australica]